MADMKFLAGAARADITPKIGTCLYGYRPGLESTCVHDNLDLTVLALRQGDETAVIMTVAVGDFQTELCNEARALVGKTCGIDASDVVIAATHTHSAPNVSGTEGWGDVDREYVDEILFPAMVKASKEAVDNLQPAEYAVGVVESKVGINRRQQLANGTITFGQNPWGCYDPYMTFVSLRNTETKAGILNIIHYGCHGTAAGSLPDISRDWSGIMVDRIEAITGVLTAYFNGAQGDVGPRLTNGRTTGGSMKYVEELGAVAAMDAKRAYDVLGGYTTPSLRVFKGEVAIPYKPLLPLDAVEAKLATYAEPEKLININKLEYNHYKAMKDVYDAGVPEHDTHYRIQQTIITFGEVAFIPFPFEIFSEISLRHRFHAPTKYTLSLSNTNGYNVYMPTEDQIVRGGYEVKCFEFSGAYPLVNNSDQVLLDENMRIMNQ